MRQCFGCGDCAICTYAGISLGDRSIAANSLYLEVGIVHSESRAAALEELCAGTGFCGIMRVLKFGSFRSMWRSRQVLAAILGFFTLNGVLIASISQHWRIQEVITSEKDRFLHYQEQPSAWISPAQSLIEETRSAIRAAGGVPGRLLSASHNLAWEVAYPCASRRELLSLWGREKRFANGSVDQKPPALLHTLFEDYSNLHRTCTRFGDMAYVTKLYKSGNASKSCKFLVVEFGTYGVGNRLLWLVSAYLYALLTKRVLLIDTRSTIHTLLCEPFRGSSWQLPEDFPYSSEERWPMPSTFQQVWDDWENRGVDKAREKEKPTETKNQDEDGLRDLSMHDIERERREMKKIILSKVRDKDPTRSTEDDSWKMVIHDRRLLAGEPPSIPSFHHVQANDGWAPNPRFFCDDEQRRLNLVDWISLNSGCLYFLPDLFAVPSMQPALEELFPNRDPLTYLLRELTLPINSIWKKAHRLYTKHFQTASKVVGIQVRYKDGVAMYKTLNDMVNKRIGQCAKDEGLLPDPSFAASSIARTPATYFRGGPVVIFVASLYPGLLHYLQKVYAESTKRSKENRYPAVKLLQLSNLGFQSFNLEADCQALAEIICLSLSDELMTSPQSTYGQVAQAYGGLRPWLIQFDPDASTNCVRGQSTEGCYQLPISRFSCPFDEELDGKAMVDVAFYLQPCQDTDGLQLVPPWAVHNVSSVKL